MMIDLSVSISALGSVAGSEWSCLEISLQHDIALSGEATMLSAVSLQSEFSNISLTCSLYISSSSAGDDNLFMTERAYNHTTLENSSTALVSVENTAAILTKFRQCLLSLAHESREELHLP
mmetsp:Transcript_31498/g.75247  ORF Transcript_31498/g.75247 Transcript_31498/m.75247 type:complete len:121 (-) Transcript_31498:372-734(-)